MLKILQHRAALVALEAHTTDNVLTLIRNVYGDVSESFDKFVSHFQPTDPALHLTAKRTEFVKKTSNARYVDSTAWAAYVPEGLSVPYAVYLESLGPAVQHAVSMPSMVLAPFSQFLSEMVSDNARSSGSQRLDVFYASLESKREGLNKAMGACFKAGSHQTDVTYGDVVDRNSDWPELLKSVDTLLNAINKVDRRALDKKAKECSQLLGIIYKKLTRGDYGDMSPQVANNLASGSYQVAKELEFYSAVYYKAAALSAAVNQTIQKYLDCTSARDQAKK